MDLFNQRAINTSHTDIYVYRCWHIITEKLLWKKCGCVSSGNRTHDPSVTSPTAGNGASLWFCGILDEDVSISSYLLICLYCLNTDQVKDAGLKTNT